MTSPDPVEAIARAVLYEGYILWPYRRSAIKNRQRWTFGGVYPRAWCAARDEGDRWSMRSELLIEDAANGRGAVEVELRFLHVVRRSACEVVSGKLRPVDELTVDGECHLSWDEARERRLALPRARLDDLRREPLRRALALAAGSEVEWLDDERGERAGAIERSWEALAGNVEARAERLEPGLHRLSVEVANATPWHGGGRDEAQRRTLVSTHVVVRAHDGAELVSLTDPPERLREAAGACENVGAWPVLVGAEGDRHTMLASPIILSDHPEVAPESPGDFFDGAEIDKMLVLNVLTLTDEEKAEMRASDPRAREILERCESMTAEDMMRLHGTIRELHLGRP